MSYAGPTAMMATPDASIGDVLAWAEAADEDYDAILELRKVPARMGMIDDDIGLIPADLQHFDKVVSLTPYGAVSRSKDLEAARRRGNARIRALLGRFFASTCQPALKTCPELWDPLIEAVEALEGFAERGAVLTTGKHRSLFAFRARSTLGPRDLTQAEVDRIHQEATAEKRKSVRKGVALLNRLVRAQNEWPGLAGRVPVVPFEVPVSPDRGQRVLWASLPEGFRADAEAVFGMTLSSPQSLADDVRAAMAAGLASTEINAMVADRIKTRGRVPKNSSTALAGYRSAVSWLVRAFWRRGGVLGQASTLADLMSRETIDAACTDQVERSQASLVLKDSRKSQTLGNRLTNLRTVARHGLRSEEAVAHVDLLRVAHHEHVVSPRELTEEADKICRVLRDTPHLATRFVRAPITLATEAEALIKTARAAEDEAAEDAALRLYESAVAYAVQLSRPLRTANLVRLRYRGSHEMASNVHWIKPRRHAELRFAPSEIKNDRRVTAHVLDGDAELLWTWLTVHRPRFLELRGLTDSPYVFPGDAKPRHVKKGLRMPTGCVSPATMAEIWSLGDERLGVGLTPHECRHAVATLMLAVEPGNFAKVASVLGDTEETARRHYGLDSGEAAAASVRQALLAQHPDLFSRIRGIKVQ